MLKIVDHISRQKILERKRLGDLIREKRGDHVRLYVIARAERLMMRRNGGDTHGYTRNIKTGRKGYMADRSA